MNPFQSFVGSAAVSMLLISSPAIAQESEKRGAEEFAVKPLLDARMRYETVDQGQLSAEALTLRLRAGAEAKFDRFSLLAEAEGTLAPVDNYNAFPFPLVGEKQRRPQHAVVADPENLELNRLQLQYKGSQATVTLGRQRINLDDQRWVGSVGWRQNEQTFDAVRAEARVSNTNVDLTYSISQRTIFGSDAGQRTALDGQFIFAGLASKMGPIQAKLFSYLLDFDEPFLLANSSQTYGAILSGTLPIGRRKLGLRASYARQLDFANNPFDYSADYWSVDGVSTFAGFNIATGWERLGSDNGRAVQTPLATLHKFNGWADMFLTTPPAGLDNIYFSVSRKFDGVKILPGLNAVIAYHHFDSVRGNMRYGSEWDASVGFRLRKLGVLLKYADYRADRFGVDTRKLWLQTEWTF